MSRLLSVVIAIFWNAPQPRLRTFWRLLGAVFLIALLSVIVGAVLLGLRQGPNPLLGQLQSNILTVAGIWLATKLLDRRKFTATGIYFDRNWWADLVFGMVLGAILMAGIFFTENATGWIRITGFFRTPGDSPDFWQAILLPMVFFILVSISEELLYRGYLLLNLAEGFRFRYLRPGGATIAALIITSALFGILHAANPNATFVSSANISIAGLWLGLAYVITGSLAIPLGIHFTWNLFQGNVFGFPSLAPDFLKRR